MTTLHFEEISKYMEEYWKTHIIVPPYKDDPPYIVGRVKENEYNRINNTLSL